MQNVMCMFSIFDSKAGIYNVPFASPNSATARRMFAMNVNEVGSMINAHPEDFILFLVGSYYASGESPDGSKIVLGLCVPVAVCNGLEVFKVVD